MAEDDIFAEDLHGRGPLTDEERLIAQNFFDTQPTRRAAYFKRLGFELNPKDDNEYRPIKSKGSYAEVDPGFFAAFRKGGLQDYMKEAGLDLGDVAYDSTIQNLMQYTGGAVGALATTRGGPWMMLAGRVLGGAAGNAASEALKKAGGDIVLDEEVPMEMAPMVLQSFMVGAAPEVLKGLAKGKDFLVREFIEKRRKGVIKAITSAGQGLTPEIIERAAKEGWTEESVKGANSRLSKLYDDLLGRDAKEIAAPENIPADSVFGQKLGPLHAEANKEINALASNPAADFRIGDMIDRLAQGADALAKKFARSENEESALSYMRKQIAFLRGKAKEKIEQQKSFSPVEAEMKLANTELQNVSTPGAFVGSRVDPDIQVPVSSVERKITKGAGLPEGVSPDDAKLNFKEAREFLSSIQDTVFDKDALGNYTMPGAEIVAKTIGGGNGIRQILDSKAASAGSALPAINAERHKILDIYNQGVARFRPESVTTAFLGKDTDPKLKIRETVKLMDQALGTNYSKDIETGAFQRVVENMYANPQAFGSGRVMQEALSAGAKGGLAGGITGGATAMAVGGPALVPMGVLAGATTGGLANASRASALASPQDALRYIERSGGELGFLNDLLKLPATQRSLGTPSRLTAIEAANVLGPQGEAPKQEEEIDDIFAQ